MPEHGTRARMQLHYKDGEKPCDPCAAAGRDYVAEQRKNPWHAALVTWYAHTRNVALARLRRENQARFLEILDEVRLADPRPPKK